MGIAMKVMAIATSRMLKKHALSNVEGAASGVPCLRRSGFAQAGRHFAVLTYSTYAPGAKAPAALLDEHFSTLCKVRFVKK